MPENIQENASLFVSLEPDFDDIEPKYKVSFISNGESLPDAKFLYNHDIFHYIVDSGVFHREHTKITGNQLEKEFSTSFHGEALIEVLGRFFTNLEKESIFVTNPITGKVEEFLAMPKKQKGFSEKQPTRIFPLDVNTKDISSLLNTSFGETEKYNQVANELKKYVIIGSLVSGKIRNKHPTP